MMQCKDIPEAPILSFLAGPYTDWPVPGSGTWYASDEFYPPNSVLRAMPEGIPAKLGRAKMGQMIRKGLVIGCACGCRGDFEITTKGREAQ